MRAYDVYRSRDDQYGIYVCLQADHLAALTSRVVVPALPLLDVPPPIPDLHPTISWGGTRYVLATHLMTTLPQNDLGELIGSVAIDMDAVRRALQVLFFGVWP